MGATTIMHAYLHKVGFLFESQTIHAGWRKTEWVTGDRMLLFLLELFHDQFEKRCKALLYAT